MGRKKGFKEKSILLARVHFQQIVVPESNNESYRALIRRGK